MSTVKRRRHTRYKIKLAATLVADNASFIQCTICDFCSGGLFLEPRQRNDVQALTPHQKIRVVFSVSLEHGGKEFSLGANVMHIRANGIGIAFENNSEAAFEALKKEARGSSSLTSADRQSNSGSLSKQKMLEADLTSLMQEALPVIIHRFYHRIEEKLSEDAKWDENSEYYTSLRDAITQLEMHKNALVDNFCAAIREAGHLTLSTPGQVEETDTEAPLALVDTDDFEDWLNLSAIIRNLESVYESRLEQLRGKIAYVIGVDRDRVINPACPAKLCDCFRDSIAALVDNAQIKQSLYAVYEETLVELLPNLHQKMDAILLKHGAPKKFVGTGNWSKIKPGTGQVDSHYAQTEQPHDVSPRDPAPVATGDNTLFSDRPFVSAKKTRPVINVASNLLHLIQGKTFPEQNSATTDAISSEYSVEEISTALAHLHENGDTESTRHHAPYNLQNELLNTLKSFSTSPKNLSSTDQNNLEVYESLFETLFNDIVLTREIQPYLQRIHLPIMDQAMLDPGFLESESHPARNVVNQLSWLESAVKDNKIVKNTRIRQTLDHLTKQIAAESSNNPAIFSSVEKQLNDITASVKQTFEHNIKRVTQVYAGKQKLDKARQSVQEEIYHGFSSKHIPQIIATLLNAGWQHLLVIAKLNDEDHDYQKYLRIVNNLNGWLTGTEKAGKEQAGTTLEFIDSQLQTICTNTLLHNTILSDLNTLLLGHSNQSGLDTMPMATLEIHENTQITSQAKSRIDEVDQLIVGEWLAVLLEHKLEPLKLVWIGDTQDVFVFVDRSGIKKLELEREELAELLSSGAANRIESPDLPVMDRAINVMLQKMHEKLLDRATHDPVTHLLNRKEFIKQLKRKLLTFDNVQRLLCNIEVQDFRIITNACGLSGGDALLKQLADLLKSQLRKEEIFARLDDKTFSILLKNRLPEAADDIAKKLQSKLVGNHFKWQDKSYSVAVSIGIVPLFPDISYDTNSVLQKADSATLSAIKAGRNRIRIYKEDDELIQSQYNVHEWVGRINQVFADDRLFLRCQKIAAIDPETNNHSHYEILLGIKDENGNIIAPDDFIPAVERCQRMSEIDRWVVLEVFSWIEQHQFDFEIVDGFSINLSGESMNSEEFLDFLKKTLATSTIPMEKITFEITETVAAGSFLLAQNFIKQIKQFNCKFSLDDFGSGYSSYSYLKSLDVDYLKIDGAFVKDILNNDTDVAIVKSMNEIAHSLGLETIAEYVESDEIHTLIKEIGVDYAQGWGIQRPILLADLA